MKPEIKINLHVNREMWERFKAIAKGEDLSASQMIRGFIRQRVARDPGSSGPQTPRGTKRRGGGRKGG